MKDTLKMQLEWVVTMQERFVELVLTELWNEDPEDYSIEISSYWMVLLSDMYLWFDDIVMIAKYEIPKDVVFEYLDDTSLNYESLDIIKYKESLKDIEDSNGNLLWFYRFKINKNEMTK